jgi:hypothetical protein
MCDGIWRAAALANFVTNNLGSEKLGSHLWIPMYPGATVISVAEILERAMKKKVLLIGGIAAATLLAGGWALAEATSPGGFGPPFMGGMGHGGMGPGMMHRMGLGTGSGMGPGMMQHMGAGMGPGMMNGAPGAVFADPAQIDTLKKELGITATQEPAWIKYTKAIQDAATTMKAARESVDPDALSKLSPQDRLAFMTKIREQGQKQFETVKTAANELLVTLDDTQKAKAQTSLPGLAFGPGAQHTAGGPPFRH